MFIRAVAYNVTYSLYIDETLVGSVTTPAADADQNELSTTAVATALAQAVGSWWLHRNGQPVRRSR